MDDMPQVIQGLSSGGNGLLQLRERSPQQLQKQAEYHHRAARCCMFLVIWTSSEIIFPGQVHEREKHPLELQSQQTN